jgi:hypothetical protein
MNTFVIDHENNITLLTPGDPAPAIEGSENFKNSTELGQLADSWTAERLVEIWNSLPGVVPVKKFTSRKTAVARIWKAIQSLRGSAGRQTANVAPLGDASGKKAAAPGKPRTTKKSAKDGSRGKPAQRPKVAGTVREGSKTAKVLAMLQHSKGATLQELMKLTGWQAHSVRGFLSGTLGKKLGLTVESSKPEDGERRYQIAR